MKRLLKLTVRKFSGFISLLVMGCIAYILSGDFSGLFKWLWTFKWLIGPLAIMAIMVPFWPTIEGTYGEYQVRKKLSKLDLTQYKVFNNLFLKLEDGKTSQIDHVVISIFGIFVIETKNYSGWISGDERSEYWTQSFFKSKKRFLNPIWQNYGHVKALQEVLKDFSGILYIPVVVFSNNAKLKRVNSEKVIYLKDLFSFMREKQQQSVNEDIMNNVFSYLKEIAVKDIKEVKKHIAGIKEKVEKKAHVCPKCGGSLIVKQGRYGAFTGCSGYPKCRYIYKGQ